MLYQIAKGVKHRPEAFGGIAQSNLGSLVVMDKKEYELFLRHEQPQTHDDLSPEETDFVAVCVEEGLLSEAS